MAWHSLEPRLGDMTFEEGTPDASGGVRWPAERSEGTFGYHIAPDPGVYSMLHRGATYKWQPAVATGADLWLVRVDKYPRVASRAAAAVAGDYAIMRPSDRLLVHQLHGRVGLWLGGSMDELASLSKNYSTARYSINVPVNTLGTVLSRFHAYSPAVTQPVGSVHSPEG